MMVKNLMVNIVAVLATFFIFVQSIDGQIVFNGDMELGTTGLNSVPSGWNIVSGTPDFCDSTPSTCVTMSYKIPNGSPQGGNWIRMFNGILIPGPNNEIVGQFLTSPLAANQKYEISFYASYSKLDADAMATTASIMLGFSNGMPAGDVGASHRDIVALTNAEEWVLHSFIFTTNAEYNYLSFGKVEVDLVNACYIDDVIINPICQVDLGPDTTLCEGVIYPLDLTAPNAVYTWQDGSTEPVFNVTGPGTYWVEVTANLCTSRDTVVIEYKPSPILEIDNEADLCIGDTYTIDATLAGATYLWPDNSTGPTFDVTEDGSYAVGVTVNECTITEIIDVLFHEPPVVDLGSDTTICEDEFLVLNPEITDATFLWQDNSTGSRLLVVEAGTYWVEVNRYGCIVGDTISFKLTDEFCNCTLAFPNVFSPNFDGINDTFEVFNTCPLSEFNYSIYNRWGAKLFESSTPGVFWDGTFNGQPADTGVYVYLVKYKFTNQLQSETRSGSFTLLR